MVARRLALASLLPLVIGCDTTPAPSRAEVVADSTASDAAVLDEPTPDTAAADDTSLADDTTTADTSFADDTTTPDSADTHVTEPPDTALQDDTGVAVPTVPCERDDDCDPGLTCVGALCACDPTPVSFSADIVPLFASTCGTSCHLKSAATGGSAGLNLAAEFAHAELVAADATQCRGTEADRLRVVPGDVGASYLMDKLLGRAMCSGVRMPKGRSAYSDARLDLVGRWICQGAAND